MRDLVCSRDVLYRLNVKGYCHAHDLGHAVEIVDVLLLNDMKDEVESQTNKNFHQILSASLCLRKIHIFCLIS